MTDPVKKRVDESWKEQVEREKQAPPAAGSPAPPPTGPAPAAPVGEAPHTPGEAPEARFDLFVSSLAMEALVALGDMPHPVTRKTATALPQAKYVIDILGILEEKTQGNLSVDESRMVADLLYQLRMRYLTKSGGVAPA